MAALGLGAITPNLNPLAAPPSTRGARRAWRSKYMPHTGRKQLRKLGKSAAAKCRVLLSPTTK